MLSASCGSSWPLSPKTIPWKTEYFFLKKIGFRGKLYRLVAYYILTGQPNDWCSDMEGTWEDLWCCAFAYIHPSVGWQLRAVVSKTLALSKSGGAWSSLRFRSLEEEPQKDLPNPYIKIPLSWRVVISVQALSKHGNSVHAIAKPLHRQLRSRHNGKKKAMLWKFEHTNDAPPGTLTTRTYFACKFAPKEKICVYIYTEKVSPFLQPLSL